MRVTRFLTIQNIIFIQTVRFQKKFFSFLVCNIQSSINIVYCHRDSLNLFLISLRTFFCSRTRRRKIFKDKLSQEHGVPDCSGFFFGCAEICHEVSLIPLCQRVRKVSGNSLGFSAHPLKLFYETTLFFLRDYSFVHLS